MFDLSWGELVLIGLVALIVIGPKELPTVLRTVGQWVTKVRRMASEFQGQFQEAIRESEFADLKKQVDSIGDPLRGVSDFDPMETTRKDIESAFDDKPAATGSSKPAQPPAGNTAQADSAQQASPGTISPETVSETAASEAPRGPAPDPALASADAPPAPPPEAAGTPAAAPSADDKEAAPPAPAAPAPGASGGRAA